MERATKSSETNEHMAASATYLITPPEQFNFSRPEGWPKWVRQFLRFQKASGLKEKDEEVQVNTLIYALGDDANDILCSFRLSAESNKYDTVKTKFDAHFAKRQNLIYERAKFNLCRQGNGEPMDSFITAPYRLAKSCGYGNLHDKIICDRIVGQCQFRIQL